MDQDVIIEFKDKGLYIDGKKQSDEIYNKYKGKIKKQPFTIMRKDGRTFIEQ